MNAVLRYRKRGWEVDERTWTAQAIDDISQSNADDRASEEAEAYDSEDSEGVANSGDEFEKIC
jgi:hypothetical protein